MLPCLSRSTCHTSWRHGCHTLWQGHASLLVSCVDPLCTLSITADRPGYEGGIMDVALCGEGISLSCELCDPLCIVRLFLCFVSLQQQTKITKTF